MYQFLHQVTNYTKNCISKDRLEANMSLTRELVRKLDF